MGEQLTDEQIDREEEFLEGLPRINVGALVMPPIWGPAHGLWASILFYPIWLFADNMFYLAYSQPSAFSLVVAGAVFLILVALTVAFSIVSQPYAAHRADARGTSRQDYLKRQRHWACVCVVLGILMLAFASFYNVRIRATLG